jgi:hypothetical protein
MFHLFILMASLAVVNEMAIKFFENDGMTRLIMESARVNYHFRAHLNKKSRGGTKLDAVFTREHAQRLIAIWEAECPPDKRGSCTVKDKVESGMKMTEESMRNGGAAYQLERRIVAFQEVFGDSGTYRISRLLKLVSVIFVSLLP